MTATALIAEDEPLLAAALQAGITDVEQGCCRNKGLGDRMGMVWNGRIAW